MVQYKWIALSNTSIAMLIASINSTIILIALPPIFKGIDLNPLAPGSFQYLIWILMGYMLITAVVLVSFGRLSDIFGRVRLFNLGFAVFTAGSILLFLTPSKGDLGASELIAFRIIQAVGGGFLFSNAAAIITDSFPVEERGKALGINQVLGLSGSFIGLILGGILATINWRYVFLVSVPVGAFGTAWSYLKLKETSSRKHGQKIDLAGNVTFGIGLTLLLLGITLSLEPYGNSQMGWGNPVNIAMIIMGIVLLAIFPFIETMVKQPMFRLSLFRNRAFAAGNLASTLGSIGRGGVMFMLVILLQGIWLPLHGYSYQSTPLWAGISMIPMTVGFLVMGPISGTISDKHGARTLATLGLLVVAAGFLALSTLPYDFSYPEFAVILLAMGMGNGMFSAPNTASIMNSLPSEERGVGSGMRSTLQNAGMAASMGMFFTIVITALVSNLPASMNSALASLGTIDGLNVSSTLGPLFTNIPATNAIFAAFLGVDPVSAMLASTAHLTQNQITLLAYLAPTSTTWFPKAIAPAFMGALRESFYIGAALSILGAIFSAIRGKVYVNQSARKVFREEGVKGSPGPPRSATKKNERQVEDNASGNIRDVRNMDSHMRSNGRSNSQERGDQNWTKK
ncbi:MAG: MFS transporter [Thermoplasmataceae archaeon]